MPKRRRTLSWYSAATAPWPDRECPRGAFDIDSASLLVGDDTLTFHRGAGGAQPVVVLTQLHPRPAGTAHATNLLPGYIVRSLITLPVPGRRLPPRGANSRAYIVIIAGERYLVRYYSHDHIHHFPSANGNQPHFLNLGIGGDDPTRRKPTGPLIITFPYPLRQQRTEKARPARQ